jgi:hypothetical protein
MKSAIAMLVTAVFCCGCSLSPIVDADIVEYNKAVSDSDNKLLLLNVLRARDHAPLMFSSVQLVHGSLQEGGSTSLSFPFGNNPLKTSDALGIGLAAQVAPTFDVSSLNTQDFTRGILQPVDPLVVKYFLDRGDVDPKIVLLLFFSELEDSQGHVISINSDSAISIQEELQDLASGKVGGGQFIANAYYELTPVGGAFTVGDSSLKDVATIDQTKYRLLPDKSATGKYRLYAISPTQKVAFCLKIGGDDQDGSGRSARFIALGNILSAKAAVAGGEDPRCTNDQVFLEPHSEGVSGVQGHASVSTRSVEGMIQFLGGVLRWERKYGKPMTFDDFIRSSQANEPTPTVFGSNTSDVFFDPATNVSDPLFSVDYMGEQYSVGLNEQTGGMSHDHTLEVLAMVSKLLDMNKSAAALPVTQSVQIVP